MKKSTFLIITAVALFGCAYFESSPTYSSEAIRTAELNGTTEISRELAKPVQDYRVRLNNDFLTVYDPETGKEIYTESLDSESRLSESILNDND